MWKILLLSCLTCFIIYLLAVWSISPVENQSIFLVFSIMMTGICLVVTFTLMSCAYMAKAGQPITADKLKKCVYYICCSTIPYEFKKGFFQIALVRKAANNFEPLVAVKLQKKLPSGTDGFFVVSYYDNLSRKVKKSVELVISSAEENNCLRMVINFKNSTESYFISKKRLDEDGNTDIAIKNAAH